MIATHRTLNSRGKEPKDLAVNVLITFKSAAGIQN